MEVKNRFSLCLFLVFMEFFSGKAFAQKPPLDTNNFESWPEINGGSITGDGRYFGYRNVEDNSSEIVVTDIESPWKQVFHGATDCQFSADSKWTCISGPTNSIILLSLTDKNVRELKDGGNVKFIDQNGKLWLTYTKKSAPDSLICLNVNSGQQIIYDHIQSFFEHRGKAYLQFKNVGTKPLYSLASLEHIGGAAHEIWCGGTAIQNVTFADIGGGLAFSINEKEAPSDNKVFYYRPGMELAISLPNVADRGNANQILENIRNFSPDGNYLFVSTVDSTSLAIHQHKAKGVDVWSYKDAKLQSEQLLQQDQNYHPMVGVYELISGSYKFVKLQQDQDLYLSFPGSSTDYAIACQQDGDANEIYWRFQSKSQYFLVDCKTGERKAINSYGNRPELSPMANYLIWYNAKLALYCSYNIKSGHIVDIKIPMVVTNFYGEPKDISASSSINHWFDSDKGLLMSDGYDLWKVDPTGQHRPVNWTNGFGKLHEITFRLSAKKGQSNTCLLEAFDSNYKEGFFLRPADISLPPKKLYLENIHINNLIKASDADVYLIRAEQSNSAPNYLVSHNLSDFRPITNFQPQKSYNWYNATIIEWKTLDGKTARGALYKPENFDPKKKYPVIFLYYEKRAYYVNHYLIPTLSSGNIDVPWYVSNGYLVVQPDINYKPGYPGWSAFNTVESCANYLSKVAWVDAKHMGLQGHSFGGFETNYIITHSSKFACAMSAAGISELTGDTFSLYLGGISNQANSEQGQFRIFNTVWERPDLYIKNSPIYSADKVNTPILLMANKEDQQVPWQQGYGFFTALRRLNKKAWMLQYDDEGHSIDNPVNQMDYSIRVKQFFDHYLKSTAPPIWMTRGIPANLKGIDKGLQLDTTGARP